MNEFGEVVTSNGKALFDKRANLLHDREHSGGIYVDNIKSIFVYGG